jgi:flagellar basal-body rod protein FlgF
MDQMSIIAASGMRARIESLDLLANNIANSSTGGYKGDSEFYSLFTSEAATEDATEPVTTLPMVQSRYTDFSQGLLQPTGNPLDFGLSGKGFFTIKGPSGNLYTRNGSFQVSTSGAVVTPEGYPLLLQDGQPIQANPAQPVEVSTDGSVRQQGQVLGQLQLVSFKDASVLDKQGNNYFVNTSGEAPEDASGVEVQQGRLEASNVNPAQAAVRLISVMRQFEMMQKAISIAGEMGRKSIEEVAKVG